MTKLVKDYLSGLQHKVRPIYESCLIDIGSVLVGHMELLTQLDIFILTSIGLRMLKHVIMLLLLS